MPDFIPQNWKLGCFPSNIVSILYAERRGRVKGKMPLPIGLISFYQENNGFLKAPCRKLLPVSLWPDLGCGHSSFKGVLKKVHVPERVHCCPKHNRRSVSEESNWRLEIVRSARSVCHTTATDSQITWIPRLWLNLRILHESHLFQFRILSWEIQALHICC